VLGETGLDGRGITLYDPFYSKVNYKQLATI
jgi:hypothetical protein